ncbi:MAG: phosphate/phosphite/phosphonate ABC transporter substrate-binding protein [bacterium]
MKTTRSSLRALASRCAALTSGALLALPLALALTLAFAPARASAEAVRFGFYPSRDRAEVELAAKAFCAHVAAGTGLTIEPVVSKNYTAGVASLTAGEVDVAWLSPFSLVSAEAGGKARVLLKSVRRDQPFYWGAVIVKKESGLETIADLKGKKFGWTDPSSTAGHLVTKAALIRAGIKPETDFGANQFLGAHDRLVKAVLDGTVDAGATFANDPANQIGAWTIYLSAEQASQIKPIFFTEPIPGDAVAGANAFLNAHKDESERLVRFLIAMGETEEGRTLLKTLYDIDRLTDAEDKDYDAVRLAVEVLRGGP